MRELIIIVVGPGVYRIQPTQNTDELARRREAMMMAIYSLLLVLALGLSSPWWLWRMASTGRYREGLGERLGFIPAALRKAIAGRKVIWVHAVSVGEVLAAERLIAELKLALPSYVVAVSTTTATGQKIARERLGGSPVFHFPLDFAFAVRAWLRVLQPSLMVLVESEFWPRHLAECERAGIPIAVVNARISDRSFPRYMRLRRAWKPVLAKISVFLAQTEETAGRLRRIGVQERLIRVTGNLKYDVPAVKENTIAQRIKQAANLRPIVIAGSTAGRNNDSTLSEDEMVIQAWEGTLRVQMQAMLILAPRHPERFLEVEIVGREFNFRKASELVGDGESDHIEVVLLDSIGDLAAIYRMASVAFIGGSLLRKGGQNPLEAARFGVPVVMGPSYENFREIVEAMRGEDAVRIVQSDELENTLVDLLRDDQGMGERGRTFFEQQAGATRLSVEALLTLMETPK